MIDFFQIYYKEEQKQKIYAFAKPYFNESLTIYFECSVIAKLVTESKAEKICVASYKLAEKMSRRVGLRVPLTLEALNSEYEVLSLTRNSQKHQMLAMGNAWHPMFKETITTLWQKLGYKMPGEAKNPIYNNFFSAKREIYLDYINNFLIPAMELTERDSEMKSLMMQESNYGQLNRQADMKSVKEKLHLNFYPISPFILERCAPLFMQIKGYKISYL